MRKRIKGKIILTRREKPIDASKLRSNEYLVTEYWKVSYEGVSPTERTRGERQVYRDFIDGISSIRGNEPEEIIMPFSKK